MNNSRQTTDALRKRCYDNAGEMTAMIRDLCGFRTVNPPGEHFKPCVDYLEKAAREAGLETRLVEVPLEYQKRHLGEDTWPHKRWNLICRLDAGARKTIHFNSHYDVVPVTGGWKTDPFRPAEIDGRLYGRGTSDMKGCLAASLFAARAIKECGITPPWNVELSFTADEEIGGECGAGYIVKEGLVKPEAVVVCEGGMGTTVSYGHRGVLWMEVGIEGKSGHGSNPACGVNAFEHGIRAARAIQELTRDFASRKTAHKAMQECFEYPTMTLGGLAGGGAKVNTIPGDFRFTIDRRLIPEEDVDQVENEIVNAARSAAEGVEGLTVRTKRLMGFNAGLTDPGSPLCKAALAAVETVHGKPADLGLFGAFTDLHFFTNHAKAPTIGYGVEGDGIHSDGEYLLVRSLPETAHVYAEIVMNMDPAG